MLQADEQEIQTAERKEKLTKDLEEEENKLLELINLKDNPINDRIRSIVSLIKDWKREDHTLFSWEDMALSMLKKPWEIEFDKDVCPKCGNKRIKLYFCSPAWTRSLMCDRGGEMKICLFCKSQDFLMDSMN